MQNTIKLQYFENVFCTETFAIASRINVNHEVTKLDLIIKEGCVILNVWYYL